MSLFTTPTKPSSNEAVVHVKVSPDSVSASVGEIYNQAKTDPDAKITTAAVRSLYQEAVSNYNVTKGTDYDLSNFDANPVYQVFDDLNETWKDYTKGMMTDTFHLTLRESKRQFDISRNVFEKSPVPKKAEKKISAGEKFVPMADFTNLEKDFKSLENDFSELKKIQNADSLQLSQTRIQLSDLRKQTSQLTDIMRRKIIYEFREHVKKQEGGTAETPFWTWWNSLSSIEKDSLKMKYRANMINLMTAGDKEGNRVAHDIALDRLPMARAVDQAQKNKKVLSSMFEAIFGVGFEEVVNAVDWIEEVDYDKEEEEVVPAMTVPEGFFDKK